MKKYKEFLKENNSDDDDYFLGIEQIKQNIKDMFKNGNYQVNIMNKEMNFSIEIYMEKKNDITKIYNVFQIINKLKNGVFVDYEAEFDIWTNRSEKTVLIFDFYGDSYED